MPLALAGAAGCGPSARDDGNDTTDTTDGGPCSPGELICSGNDVVECDADGNPGDLVEACSAPRTCSEGACVDDGGCSDEAKLIYVVDNSNRLLSFDPNVLEAGGDPFTQLGTLDCPAGGALDGSGAATPFSMSVDRSATAWILYNSGEIFHVPVDTVACTDSGFTPGQQGMELFGMGFVTDTAGGETEQLYISGGDAAGGPGGNLAVINPTSLDVSIIGAMRSDTENSAELTGTGDAELYAFYPGLEETFVQQVNKASGAGTGTEFDYPGGLGTGGLFEGVVAWAFAQWGGKFYLFSTVQDQFEGTTNSTVRTIDPVGGQSTLELQNLPYMIVGAGVSTCAPPIID